MEQAGCAAKTVVGMAGEIKIVQNPARIATETIAETILVISNVIIAMEPGQARGIIMGDFFGDVISLFKVIATIWIISIILSAIIGAITTSYVKSHFPTKFSWGCGDSALASVMFGPFGTLMAIWEYFEEKKAVEDLIQKRSESNLRKSGISGRARNHNKVVEQKIRNWVAEGGVVITIDVERNRWSDDTNNIQALQKARPAIRVKMTFSDSDVPDILRLRFRVLNPNSLQLIEGQAAELQGYMDHTTNEALTGDTVKFYSGSVQGNLKVGKIYLLEFRPEKEFYRSYEEWVDGQVQFRCTAVANYELSLDYQFKYDEDDEYQIRFDPIGTLSANLFLKENS